MQRRVRDAEKVHRRVNLVSVSVFCSLQINYWRERASIANSATRANTREDGSRKHVLKPQRGRESPQDSGSGSQRTRLVGLCASGRE